MNLKQLCKDSNVKLFVGCAFVQFTTRGAAEKAADATLIVNLRDLAKGMLRCPDRCVAMVVAMAELPRDVRPAALLFEEPFGECVDGVLLPRTPSPRPSNTQVPAL